MIKRLEAVVRGRVQMVMYRDFTSRTAKRLGVVGTVQNESDGTVKVVAEGEEAILKDFERELWSGSVFSRVASVDSKWEDATNAFSTFTIVYRNLIDRL